MKTGPPGPRSSQPRCRGWERREFRQLELAAQMPRVGAARVPSTRARSPDAECESGGRARLGQKKNSKARLGQRRRIEGVDTGPSYLCSDQGPAHAQRRAEVRSFVDHSRGQGPWYHPWAAPPCRGAAESSVNLRVDDQPEPCDAVGMACQGEGCSRGGGSCVPTNAVRTGSLQPRSASHVTA